MPYSLQQSGLTGRRIMFPLDPYKGLTRPPRSITTPQAIMPGPEALPGAIKPDTGVTLPSGNDIPGNIGGITSEELAGMKDTTLADVGNFAKNNIGRIAAYGGALALGGPPAAIGLGIKDALFTGARKALGYGYKTAKSALGFGPKGEEQLGMTMADPSELGPSGWGPSAEEFGQTMADPMEVSGVLDSGWFGGSEESDEGIDSDIADAVASEESAMGY